MPCVGYWMVVSFLSCVYRFRPWRVKLVLDRHTGASLGYGFMNFRTMDDAFAAIAEMNGKQVEDKKLKITLAKPREEVKCVFCWDHG